MFGARTAGALAVASMLAAVGSPGAVEISGGASSPSRTSQAKRRKLDRRRGSRRAKLCRGGGRR